MDLSLAFLMTEANRYADAAKRILPEIVSWPTDDDDVTSVSARWGDEPGLSSSKCAHFAYDWFYDALNGGKNRLSSRCVKTGPGKPTATSPTPTAATTAVSSPLHR